MVMVMVMGGDGDGGGVHWELHFKVAQFNTRRDKRCCLNHMEKCTSLFHDENSSVASLRCDFLAHDKWKLCRTIANVFSFARSYYRQWPWLYSIVTRASNSWHWKLCFSGSSSSNFVCLLNVWTMNNTRSLMQYLALTCVHRGQVTWFISWLDNATKGNINDAFYSNISFQERVGS